MTTDAPSGRPASGELEKLRKRVAELEAMASQPDADAFEERRLLRFIMDHAPDHIYLKDRDSRFVRISRSLARHLALDHPSQAVGTTDADYFGAEHVQKTRADEQEIVRTGRPLVGVTEKETWPSGQETWVSTTKVPVIGAQGQVIGIFGISRDITERHQMAERLQHRARLVSLGRFAGGVAHDLNNALMVIILYTELVMQDASFPKALSGDLQNVLDEASDATELVRQVLDFGRRTQVQRAALDLGELLPEWARLLARLMPESVEVSVAPLSGRYIINGDQAQIQQTCMNLALNSRDALPDGGDILLGLKRFTVAPDDPVPTPGVTPGDWIVLTVSDNGMGISPEDMPHMFEPFYTTKPEGRGAGLGLAQVYGIVGQHDGYVDAQSNLSGGTTMSVYLPSEAEAEGTLASEPRVATPPPENTGAQELILLVEDEASVRDICKKSLGRLGYRVITASNGREGLDVYHSTPGIDVVLTDMVMPEMSGRELGAALRQEAPDQAIVFMTGYFWALDADALHEEGIDEIVHKPLDLKELARVVRHAIDRQR